MAAGGRRERRRAHAHARARHAQGATGAHRAPESGSRTVAPGTPRRLSRDAVLAATLVAFAAGSLSGYAIQRGDRDDARARVEAAEHRARADRAATVRLTAQATRYAAARQDDALAAALAALADAQVVLAAAPAIVGQDTVAPLDEAVAELSALAAQVAPTLVQLDQADLRAVADAELAADVVALDQAHQTAPLAATPPGTAAADAAPGQLPGHALGADGTTASRVPSGPSAPLETSPAAAALALAGVPGDVLDLGSSARLLAAAQRVAALAAQVGALSDELSAELAAAAEAAELRRAEEEAKRIAAESEEDRKRALERAKRKEAEAPA